MMPVLYVDDDRFPLQPSHPAPLCPAEPRLVQFTDTHLMRDPAGSIRGARTLPRLQACLAHARRHYFPVDAMLLTGDVVHDEPEAYGAIDLLFGDLGAPVLVIPGNHDVPDEMRRQLGHAPFQVGGQWRTRNGWRCCCSSPGSPNQRTARAGSGPRKCRRSSAHWRITPNRMRWSCCITRRCRWIRLRWMNWACSTDHNCRP